MIPLHKDITSRAKLDERDGPEHSHGDEKRPAHRQPGDRRRQFHTEVFCLWPGRPGMVAIAGRLYLSGCGVATRRLRGSRNAPLVSAHAARCLPDCGCYDSGHRLGLEKRSRYGRGPRHRRFPPMKQVSVLGTPLCATSYDELTAFLQQHVREKRGEVLAVDFSNTHIVTARRHDVAFKEATDAMDLFIPDGMPLIWAMNRAGAELKDRVYGPTFMRHCVLRSRKPFTHFFLGASEECLAQLETGFKREAPDLEISGVHHGYFGIEDEETIVATINRIRPDFIWVGLGTPKQQDWIRRNKLRIAGGILLAVGFAFDVNAGTKQDAPMWMQRAGLTWLYRLLKEPRRLWKRYLVNNSLFVFYLLRDALFPSRRQPERS